MSAFPDDAVKLIETTFGVEFGIESKTVEWGESAVEIYDLPDEGEIEIGLGEGGWKITYTDDVPGHEDWDEEPTFEAAVKRAVEIVKEYTE